jgi:hypothetical protein
MNSRRLMLDPKIRRRIIATKLTILIGAEPASLLGAPDVRVKRRNCTLAARATIVDGSHRVAVVT